MMQKFEKTMRKNISRGNYTIDISSDEGVDDNKFYQNRRGAFVCDIVVCYKDEFEEAMNRLQSLEEALEEKNNTIKSLKNDLNDVDITNLKNTQKIKDNSTKRIDELNNTIKDKDKKIHELELKYEKKIANLNEENLKQINENNENHYKELDSEKEKVYQAKENYLALTIHNNESDDMYFEKLDNLGRFEKFFNKDKEIIKEMRERNRLKVDDNYIEGKIKEIKGD